MEGKRSVSLKAVALLKDKWHDDFILGIGTGSTMAIFFEELLNCTIPDGLCLVPTSMQAEQLIVSSPLSHCLRSLNQCPVVDLVIDGVDRVLPSSGIILKGGGGAMFQEKVVREASREAWYLVTRDKEEKVQSVRVPVEVPSWAIGAAMKQLGGSLRESGGKGRMGPMLTDNGNCILDVTCHSEELAELAMKLDSMAVVLGHGIFLPTENTKLIRE